MGYDKIEIILEAAFLACLQDLMQSLANVLLCVQRQDFSSGPCSQEMRMEGQYVHDGVSAGYMVPG